MQRHLGSQLVAVLVPRVGILDGTLDIFTNIEIGMADVFAPPMYQLVVVGSLIAYLPINLGHAIVHPAFLVPQQHVGIEVVVVLQAVGTAAVGIAALVAVDAEGGYTDFHPRLGVMDGIVELFNELVDVIAAPVGQVAETVIVCPEVGIIGNGYACHGIGIEIVVDVQAVDIVARHNVAHHVADIVAALLQGRIQQRQAIVLERPFRMLHDHMALGIGMSHLRLGTVWVNPCMQLHAALMALANHPCQGVPIGAGAHALLSRQVVAPRFQRTLVERIALRAHLEDNGIAAVLLQFVQLVC